MPSRSVPNVADVGPDLVAVKPKLAESTRNRAGSIKIGQDRPNVLAEFWRNSLGSTQTRLMLVNVGRFQTKLGRCWPTVGQVRSNSAQSWPLAGQTWADFNRSQTNSDEVVPNSAGPNSLGMALESMLVGAPQRSIGGSPGGLASGAVVAQSFAWIWAPRPRNRRKRGGACAGVREPVRGAKFRPNPSAGCPFRGEILDGPPSETLG